MIQKTMLRLRSSERTSSISAIRVRTSMPCAISPSRRPATSPISFAYSRKPGKLRSLSSTSTPSQPSSGTARPSRKSSTATSKSCDTNMPSRANAAAGATPVTSSGNNTVSWLPDQVRDSIPCTEEPAAAPSLSAASIDSTTFCSPPGSARPSSTGSPAADGMSSTLMMRPVSMSGIRSRIVAAIARVRGTMKATSGRSAMASNQPGS